MAGTLQRWTFNNQPVGVTPSLANIDDQGDPGLSVCSAGGTPATVIYSADHPQSGTTGLKVDGAAGSTFTMRTVAVAATDRYAMQFNGLYLTAYPTSAAVSIMQWRYSGGNQCSLNLDTAGRLYLFDNSSGSALLATTPLPLATSLLVDALPIVGTTASNSSFKWRATRISDSTVIDQKSSNSVNLNNAAGSPSVIVASQWAKSNSGGAISGMYIDNVAVLDQASDYISASQATLDFTGTLTPASATAGTTAITATVTPNGGDGSAINYVIDWKDGTSTTRNGSTAPSESFTHVYSAAGSYSPEATITNVGA